MGHNEVSEIRCRARKAVLCDVVIVFCLLERRVGRPSEKCHSHGLYSECAKGDEYPPPHLQFAAVNAQIHLVSFLVPAAIPYVGRSQMQIAGAVFWGTKAMFRRRDRGSSE